jgi:hypothetical protein
MTEVVEPHYRPFFGDADSQWGMERPIVGPLVRRALRIVRRHNTARRAYLSWLNHVRGGVQMNMIATKPVRYAGQPEGLGATQRLMRLLAASVRLNSDRKQGRAPARLPRTPEEVAQALTVRSVAPPTDPRKEERPATARERAAKGSDRHAKASEAAADAAARVATGSPPPAAPSD